MDARSQRGESEYETPQPTVGSADQDDVRASRQSIAVVAAAVTIALLTIVAVALLYEVSGQARLVGDDAIDEPMDDAMHEPMHDTMIASDTELGAEADAAGPHARP